MAAEDSKSIQELLSLPILLADRTIKSAREAEFFKLETSELALQVTLLAELLRTAARIASGAAVYDRPIRRVSLDVTKTLESALALAHKCRRKRAAVLHVLAITTAADFKKLSTLLESSVADIRWCLSILNHEINLSLPPIATTEPNLAWIWPYIAAVHAGRADAAKELANWARDNDHNRRIIVEENGIPPLLNMLNNSGNVDAQGAAAAAAAAALCNLADSPAGVKRIVAASGVKIIVKALSEVPIFVRITLVNLVSRMSEGNAEVQEEFGRENVTRLLVAYLGMDIDLEEFNEVNSVKPLVSSLHSLVEINKEMMGNRHVFYSRNDKEKEPDSLEIRLTLKLSCANALWKLARENSKKIAEKKALLVLGKTIEKESSGELRMNCLMVVMELAAVAEANSDLKRAAFKPNSAPAKLILNQLLRVINNESSALLVIPAIKAIGCLASMFSAKEKQIVKSLVGWLGLRNSDIACEAAKALCKFVRCDNYNCKEHSKAMIEFGGVDKVMEMLRSKERGHLHELVLLCHLAINAGNSKALEEAKALIVVEGALRHVVAQNPALKELFTKAIHQLTIYQSGDPA